MTCALVSNATKEHILKYDPSAERRAASLDVSWDPYLEEASELLLEDLEHGWYPKYIERQTVGLSLFRFEAGKIFSTFDKSLIIQDNITIIRLHVFKALELFYSNLETDISNVNEVDSRNYEIASKRFSDEFLRAQQLNNFYDVNLDGVIDKQEENINEDPAFYMRDRRYY